MAEPRVIDGRELEPPEPLELTLMALEQMGPGEELILLVYCEPVPLYSVLDRNGYRHSSKMREDGTNEISITKP
ncbi:MAG: DUF2249 domain-containing protein [Sterolibacterium sp.]|nr:DUF2249 domain-containing protein [Sterolibacterium sp.]